MRNINFAYIAPLIFVSMFLTGCSSDSVVRDDSYSSSNGNTSSSDYSEFSTFNGYECTEDCSGHEAGYDWAEENDITDSSECGGNSNSFIEGCESYAEENGY